MKTFEAILRDAGNNSTFEITIPRVIVDYESLKEGDILEIAIISKKGAN